MNRFFLLTTSIIALTSAAYADNAVTIPQIVISATRSPTDIAEIASSITVITEEDIKRKNKPTVTELLREVPGVTVANNGGVGQTTRLFMRGTNSNHVLVLMDGIALNDPSDPGDAFDFSNLSTDNIERIEVLRGAQSTLYGSQAIGGVVNIISKKGKGAPKQNAFAEYGRYNSSKVGMGSSGEIGHTSYSLQASNLHTDGISALSKTRGGTEKDGNNSYTAAANIASKLTDDLTAKMNLRYNRSVTEFDSAGSLLPRPFDDPLPDNDSRQINSRMSGEWSLMGGKWVQELGVGYLHLNRNQITEYYDSLFNIFFGRQQYWGWRSNMDWVHRVTLIPGHALTFGAETSRDHFKSLSVSERDVGNVGLFFDDQYVITPNLFINAGIRTDIHQTFGRQSTWKLAPGYTVKETGTRLKATYGKGFKAPSLFQLFDDASGNADLKPEQSDSWDAGFEQALFGDKVTFGATVFRNDIDNLISFDSSPPYAAINIGKARTQGVESSVTVRPLPLWSVKASHTFTQADDRRADKQLSRRPKHQANLSTTYQYSIDGDVGVNVRYVGKSSDIDYQSPYGRTYNRPFATVDLSTNYKLNPAITLYGRLDNLFDKRYEEVYGFGQPGMALYGGVKTEF